MYGFLLPVLAQEFVAKNTSASIALVGSCIIIALLFWSKRVSFINIIIAFYIFRNYLIKPYVSIFEKGLSTKHLSYIEAINSYFNPEAAAVVYWSLFSVLLAWLIGLLLLKSPGKGTISSSPKIFTRIDQVILGGGLSFWCTWGLIFVLSYAGPGAGLRGTVTGEGSRLFLWGLASLFTINFVCLYTFLKRQDARLKPVKYSLLVPLLVSVLFGTLSSGSRGVPFLIIMMGLVYWLGLNINKKWKWQSLLKTFCLFIIVIQIAIILALYAQILRPLFRYTETVDFTMILETLNSSSVLIVKEELLFGITELLHRTTALKAQFYILNDWYIHNPWQYYNPITSLMRCINDLIPGNVFPGMLTINQLFDYIYYNTILVYNSEMWSIQGTLYIYFGHILSPIVVLFIAIITNRLYPAFRRNMMTSPAFAAFFTFLLFDIITNGTIERIIPVDIVRPLSSFVIFGFLYKVFSLFLPTRIKITKRGIASYSPSNI